MTPEHFPVRNQYDTLAIAIDLDGTLAPDAEGEALGEPNVPLAAWMERMRDTYGAHVIIWSARPVAHEPMIRAWLDEWDLWCFDQIALSSKPPADVFLDDKGLAAPLEVIEQWMWWRIAGRNLDAWAGSALQGVIADGNAACKENPDGPREPDSVRSRFKVVVPVSGGVDSTTCWLMARAADYDVWPIYVDTGAAYSEEEWATVQRLHELIGGPAPQRLDLGDVPYERWLHIDRGRNAIITMACAQALTAHGLWGEVWLGNLADFWSETPIWGGDKSSHWLLNMNQLLTLDGHRVRIVSPLGAMTKPDAVAWCRRRGHDDVLLATRSCYDAHAPCGRCRSCWRRWMALSLNDIELDHWPAGTEFGPIMDEAREKLAQRSDETSGPGRTAELEAILEIEDLDFELAAATHDRWAMPDADPMGDMAAEAQRLRGGSQ